MDQQQNNHGDPQLSFDRDGCGAEERFDVQVLLHPFEQQLDPPPFSVQQRDLSGGQLQFVAEELEAPAAGRVDVPYASQVPAGDVFAVASAEPDDLVAHHAGLRVRGQALDRAVAHLEFGSGDEEGAGLMDAEEALEIDVAAVQDVEGTGQQRKQVEGGDVGGFCVGNP